MGESAIRMPAFAPFVNNYEYLCLHAKTLMSYFALRQKYSYNKKEGAMNGYAKNIRTVPNGSHLRGSTEENGIHWWSQTGW
jgi:hypothetical protein